MFSGCLSIYGYFNSNLRKANQFATGNSSAGSAQVCSLAYTGNAMPLPCRIIIGAQGAVQTPHICAILLINVSVFNIEEILVT